MSAPRRQAEPGFRPNEFLATLARIKRDEPRRYAREVSAGQRRRVELYEVREARGRGIDREGEGGLKTLIEDRELKRLRAMAEGMKPFRSSPKWERLAARDAKEFWKLPARERLAVGYYQTAKRRAAVLVRDAEGIGAAPG